MYKEIMFFAFLLCVSFQAIKARFANVLESEDALLAAVTLPKLKLCWLHDQERKDRAKASLLAECRNMSMSRSNNQVKISQHCTGILLARRMISFPLKRMRTPLPLLKLK